MIRPLLTHGLRTSAPATAIISATLAMYIATIIAMFDPALGESLRDMRDAMPELFAALGMDGRYDTLIDFMVTYLYGFCFTALPLTLVLLLVNRLFVRPVEKGTLASLLASPRSRLRIAGTQVGVLAAALLATLALSSACELACAEALFPGELSALDLVRANLAVLALWTFFSGVCLLSACCLKRPGAALWAGGGICIAAILIEMAAQVGAGLDAGGALELLAWATPMTLYDPAGIVAGEGGAIAGCIALFSLGLACAAGAIAAFCHRDFDV